MAANHPARHYWRDRRSYALILVLFTLMLWRLIATASDRNRPERLAEGVHEVDRVIDAQTLLLASGARVRLQGINLPASRAARESTASAAKDLTQRFIDDSDGKINLTFGVERDDGNGHFLAFVWHNDALLNEELVRAGLAHVDPEYRRAGLMRRRLAAAQEEARRAALGLWRENGTGPISALPR